MMMHLSRGRTILVYYQFFKQLRHDYGKKPIFTDDAHRYNAASRWLRFPHQKYSAELKNVMERFIQHIKDRTECFDDHFSCRKPDCDRQHIWNWLKLYLLYIHMNMDKTRFMTFFAMDRGQVNRAL
jgi:transposase-like protein